LGIGLALVKSIVLLHGGNITARSKGLGLGSEFIVSLPIFGTEQYEDMCGNTIPVEDAQEGLRILVVDDNIDAAQTLGTLLESTGHTVRVEHHPVRALEHVHAFFPDVCLLDIGLPEISGLQLARNLRQISKAAHATLIALSGYGQPHDREAALAAGFDHYLIKPVDAAKLIPMLTNTSKQRRLSTSTLRDDD
jgi:CheY-like chemotaxis protein